MYYVYLLVSEKNNKTYVGYSEKEPIVRLKEHNSGTNKYTRYNRPWKLIYYESFLCEKCVRNREKFLKTGIGKKLRKVIINNFNFSESGAIG